MHIELCRINALLDRCCFSILFYFWIKVLLLLYLFNQGGGNYLWVCCLLELMHL